jgi:hypothetical protein
MASAIDRGRSSRRRTIAMVPAERLATSSVDSTPACGWEWYRRFGAVTAPRYCGVVAGNREFRMGAAAGCGLTGIGGKSGGCGRNHRKEDPSESLTLPVNPVSGSYGGGLISVRSLVQLQPGPLPTSAVNTALARVSSGQQRRAAARAAVDGWHTTRHTALRSAPGPSGASLPAAPTRPLLRSPS